MRDRIINILVTILVLAALVYIFRAEIAGFLGGMNASSVSEFLKKGVDILVAAVGKVWGLIKAAFVMVADLVLRIVSGAKGLFDLISGAISLLTKVLNFIYTALSSVFGKP